jgi:hypothetical protein
MQEEKEEDLIINVRKERRIEVSRKEGGFLFFFFSGETCFVFLFSHGESKIFFTELQSNTIPKQC